MRARYRKGTLRESLVYHAGELRRGGAGGGVAAGAGRRRGMKARGGIRLGIGAALCVVGFVLAKGTSAYRETRVAFDAGGCHLVTDIIDKGEDETQGSVVLLHGLSANKKIMEQLAQAFAEQNLRVFVPDLPGHGRTAGPFTFARAENCAESLVRELIARNVVEAPRMILAGHSMGGAIAIRVGARVG